jgi:hypothetical protein
MVHLNSGQMLRNGALMFVGLVRVSIFIDALDEYLESDIEEHQNRYIATAEIFGNLAKPSPANIRFYLSSRPYPEYTTPHDAPQLQLDRHTSGGVQLYVRQGFRPITREARLVEGC